MNWPEICNVTSACRCEMCAPENPEETHTRKHMAWCLARELARWTRPDWESFLAKKSKPQQDWLIRAIATIQESKHERAG